MGTYVMVRGIVSVLGAAFLAGCTSLGTLLDEGAQQPGEPVNRFADTAPLLPDPALPAWRDPAYDAYRSVRLSRFASEEEFQAWLRGLEGITEQELESADGDIPPPPPPPPPPAPAPGLETVTVTAAKASDASPAANPEITNNQIRGVDEGDIVKQVGDHLVILQDGRLFITDLMPDGAPGLALDTRADVYRSDREDTWYDELLVAGRTLLVTGYSYREDATEFTVLRLNEDASVTRQATFYLASEDYYDTDNYATRMIDGKLVIHTPIFLYGQGWWDAFDPPKIREWQKESAEGGRIDRRDLGEPLFRAEDIWMPVQRVADPVIHTVTVCDIDGATDKSAPACSSNAIVGTEDYEFLVTREAFWLWMAPGYSETWIDEPAEMSEAAEAEAIAMCEGDLRPGAEMVGEGALVQLPIDGSEPRVTGVRGKPQNQFSMDMDGGEFRALLDWNAADCPRWMGKETAELAYFATPLDSLSDTLDRTPDSAYVEVPSPKGAAYEARFTPDYLVYGGRSSWGDYPPAPNETDARDTGQAIVLPTADPRAPQFIDIPHGVIRAERAGPYMALTGYRDVRGLNVSLIDLRDTPRLGGTIVLGGRYESENRSHAFNSSIARDGTGLIGIPTVRNEEEGGRWWFWSDTSDMTYLTVRANASLTLAGTLRANADSVEEADYECEVSCIDWYGNARPIFTGGRNLALVNSEIIEGEMVDGRMHELHRLNILMPPPRAVAGETGRPEAP